MSRVIVKQVSKYDYAVMAKAIRGIFDSCGGITEVVKPGQRVLLKPNLLGVSRPDDAIVTHPIVVRAVAELVLEAGAWPFVSDSPAMGTWKKLVVETGMVKALEGLDVPLYPFKRSKVVEAASPFKKIELAQEALEADVVINLPKLKTHSQMLLTLCVKNLFGCVVGMKKPEWHYRAGIHTDYFARLLVTIHNLVRPAFTILDGVLAMEGDGPGKSGTPRHLGVLMGGQDGVAVDIAVCHMIGLTPERLATNAVAIKEMGCRVDDIVLDGELPEVRGFKLPETGGLLFGPKFLHKWLRKYFLRRPESDRQMCKLCGECWKYCPALAIQGHKKKQLAMDYNKCIRCFCCVEVCPFGAMKTKVPLGGKALQLKKLLP